MGRALAITAGLLLAVFAMAAGAAAQDDYDLVERSLGVDFLHAGDPSPQASYVDIMGSGACVLDHDGDGWEDLFLVNARYDEPDRQAQEDPRSALYRNLEGTGFEKVDDALEISAWGMGCATGDVDGDGDPDLALNTWGGPLLFRNDGGAVFTNVTDAAGVEHRRCGEHRCFGSSVAFLDVELDGDLDLYATNYLRWDGQGIASPNAYPGACNLLFENLGDGTFQDVTTQAGVGDCGNNHLGLAIRDVDGDGYQDIYVASDETANALFLNEQDGTFRDVRDQARVADERGGMGTAAADYDGDGRQDLVITHFEGERFGLYHQGSDGVFEDRADEAGLGLASHTFTGWGSEFLDLEMDGDLDLVLVNGHVNVSYADPYGYGQEDLVLRNDGAGTFEDVTQEIWHPAPREDVGRGLAVADWDQDGYMDLVVVNNPDQKARLFSSAGGGNNWLHLTLQGAGEVNPDALGAVVRVTAGNGQLEREVVAQASYQSQSTRALRFGLGETPRVESLEVTWPDGTVQTFEDILANQRLALTTGGALEQTTGRVLAEAPLEVEADRVSPVVLEGSAHRAPANATMRWTVNGQTTQGALAQPTFDQLGTYSATYEVDVAEGRGDVATTTIHVRNLPPTPVLDVPVNATGTDAVTLDGSQSHDPETQVANWTWQVEGQEVYGPTVEHAFSTSGQHTVLLTVRDDEGGVADKATVITIENIPPTARAGPDLVGNLQSTFRFNATPSEDPEGGELSYAWELGDGTTASGATVDHAYGQQGTYTVTLTVEDDHGATDQDTLQVTVNGQNAPPVPLPGKDRTTDRLTPVHLDATDSYDPDGSITSHTWALGDGTTATGPVVDHTYGALGNYTARLTVQDDVGGQAEATVNVTVVNLPPQLTAEPRIDQEGLAPVALTVTAQDPDGQVDAVDWELGDGTTASGTTVEHAYNDHGQYTARATATDTEGATSHALVQVRLYARPVANPGPDVVADRLHDVVLDATGSHDPDGSITSYTWDLGDGTTATGPTVTHRYDELGTHEATLTVRDDDGFTDQAMVNVTVRNLPPKVALALPSIANVDQQLTYDARLSHDPDGWIAGWTWRMDDGSTLQGPRVRHGYAATGTYHPEVHVVDNEFAATVEQGVVEVTDQLLVDVAMDQASYHPMDRPRGEVLVRFAGGQATAGAQVSVQVVYQAQAPVANASTPLYQWTLEGTTDGSGRFTFEAPGVVRAQPPLVAPSTPTGPDGEELWGTYRVVANATWSVNHGEDQTAYTVGTPVVDQPPVATSAPAWDALLFPKDVYWDRALRAPALAEGGCALACRLDVG